jgi:hypothetical protein
MKLWNGVRSTLVIVARLRNPWEKKRPSWRELHRRGGTVKLPSVMKKVGFEEMG